MFVLGLAVKPLSKVVSGIDAAKAVLHLLRTRYDDDIARESMDVGPIRGSPLQTI